MDLRIGACARNHSVRTYSHPHLPIGRRIRRRSEKKIRKKDKKKRIMTPDTAIPSAIKTEPAKKPVVGDYITPKKIRILGVPLDLGQSRRGVDMGPSAVRVAGLEARLEELGHVVEDGGNVAVALPEQKKEGDPHAKYLKEIASTCTKHAEMVVKTLEAGKVPLTLGGD